MVKFPTAAAVKAKNWLTKALGIGTKKPLFRTADSTASAVAKKTAIRPVGKQLESIHDVFKNPQLLKNRTPAEIESILRGTPGYRIETLGRGSRAGQGWVFREYTSAGNRTGAQLRWHPGGGHHGPRPYWRVNDGRGLKTDPIYDDTGWRP